MRFIDMDTPQPPDCRRTITDRLTNRIGTAIVALLPRAIRSVQMGLWY
jgi:hypothetical protein